MRRWSLAEDEVLCAMLADDADNKAIARALGRSSNSVYMRRMRFRPNSAKSTDLSTAETRQATNARSRQRPSSAMEIERDRRAAAASRASITGAVCGDPPPGFSALERRRL